MNKEIKFQKSRKLYQKDNKDLVMLKKLFKGLGDAIF